MVEEKILDLSKEESICGDISIHVLEELEEMAPGSRLVVKTRLPLSVVIESLKLLEETGVAKISEISREGGLVVAIIEKR